MKKLQENLIKIRSSAILGGLTGLISYFIFMILFCYLDCQTDFVSVVRPLLGVEGSKSSTRTLTGGAAQGSVLRPPLYVLDTAPVADIM